MRTPGLQRLYIKLKSQNAEAERMNRYLTLQIVCTPCFHSQRQQIISKFVPHCKSHTLGVNYGPGYTSRSSQVYLNCDMKETGFNLAQISTLNTNIICHGLHKYSTAHSFCAVTTPCIYLMCHQFSSTQNGCKGTHKGCRNFKE